jgi:RNA polymerase sigma-70 factor (ECF subfamily)
MFPDHTAELSHQAAQARGNGGHDRGRNGPDMDTARESEAIAGRFLEGDNEAVRTVSEWARSVVAHRVWGFENTEDIVQATLLALVQNLRDGRFTGGNLRAYVRRIAKNMCIDAYRKIRTRGDHVPLEESERHSPVRHHGEEMARDDMIGRILERLSEECRRIILLAYIQGYSRREISNRLGISEQAARVRLYRCIRIARSLLSGPGEMSMEHA